MPIFAVLLKNVMHYPAILRNAVLIVELIW
jgi:hypothetical protein